ncbi:hypothetical protein NOK12_20380 [Nocardioides sp. OK12]|uniref:hypothetical protein n=1 Tax=Nocardioides sp. OK12 TaxID=2758661 RepID=UPI0021C25E80|nr:hypothetical protein [Nocardioides sp. OK12]GHJ59520.1 hypothetical protein NOK12_20380 [Nocardioides sp. OK12]
MTARPTVLTALTGSAAVLALTLGACGGGEDEPTASTTADADLDTGADTGSEDDGGDAGGDDTQASDGGTGQVVVAGTTYSFTPTTCVFSPGDAQEFSINGPGEAEDGTPVFVDAVGPNQLVVYVGTAEAFGEADTIYEVNPMLGGGGPTEPMAGLEAGDGSVSATPGFYRVDESRTEFEDVGQGELEVSCG